MISLAQNSGPPLDYVFQGGLTQQMQARVIGRYAVDHLNLKRFAVVYPNSKHGQEARDAFWDTVQENGGKVVGAESYDPKETDFRQPVDKLSGLFYSEARSRELEVLARMREENDVKKRNRRTEKFFALAPIVDYDAVFIPDVPQVAGQIIPTFAYRDVEKVKFLGNSSWNSPGFMERAKEYGENTVFLDAFFSESSNPRERKYAERYKASFGQEANVVDALAYDAGALLYSIVGNGKDRSDVRDAIKGVSGFQGVTGKITQRDGELLRDMSVLTVKSGKIVELE
jgi:ABC-type branched-subunit amino acid transport system substrate-binding protein